MVQSLKKGLATLVAILAGAMAFAQVTTSSLAGQVTDENGVAITGHYVESLTGTAKTVRTINMDVKVYKKGHSSTDAPLTEIQTTKGE